MRAIVLLLVLICSCAPYAWAVPVDPSAPDQVAAWFCSGEISPSVNLLRTNGEVWTWRPAQGWYRAGESDGSFLYDPPVPVVDIVDWTPWVVQTRHGSVWILNDLATWQEIPSPPFSPITTSKQSLGRVKQLFR